MVTSKNTDNPDVETSQDNALIRFAKKVVPAPIKLATKARWKNGRVSLMIPDRVFLENTAIPFFAETEEIKTVLDIGVDWYTWRYNRLFPNQEYHSIDFDPGKARFASDRHIEGSLLELDQHYKAEQFDLIMCNGVFGWGVNEPETIQTGAMQITKCLAPGGYLVVGWNDNDERRPEGLEAILADKLEPFVFPPVNDCFFDTNTAHRHLFRFYRKPLS